MRLLLVLAISLFLVACGERPAEEASAIPWVSYPQAMEQAKQRGLPAMLLFTQRGCRFCYYMEEVTLKDPKVLSLLREAFVLVKVEAEGHRDLLLRFRVFVFPTIWFYSSEGDLIGPVTGYRPPQEFAKILEYISSGAYKTKSFEEFLGG